MSAHPQEQLSAFLDGELAPAERAQVEQHLRACAACAQELSELALVDRMGRELEVDVPVGYVEGLPARLRPRLRAAGPAARRRLVPAWVLGLAALVLIGVLLPITWRNQGLESPAPARESQAKRAGAPMPAAVPTLPPPQAAPATRAPRLEEAVVVPQAPRGASDNFAAPPKPAQPTPMPEAKDKDELKSLGYMEATREQAPAATPAPSVALDSDRLKGRLGLAPGVARAPAPTAAPAEAPAAAGPPPPPAPPPAAAASEPAVATRTLTDTAELDLEQAPARRQRAGEGANANSALAGAGRSDAEPVSKAAVGTESFADLSARTTLTAPEARRRRQEWRKFAELHPGDARADEARVRAVEAAALAYRLSGERTDKQTLEDDVKAYLKRGDAKQKDRVRQLSPEPRP